MKRIISGIFFTGLLLSANAQELFSDSVSDENKSSDIADLSGYGRGIIFGGGKAFDYASVFGEICLKTKISKGHAFLFSDIRFRSGFLFDEKYTLLQLKETFAGYTSNRFDLFLGYQIINWGRTDGFNPTNNITPNDYFFLSSDPDDQKLPNFMGRSKIRFSEQSDLELIVIPFFTPSVYRYDLFKTGQNIEFSEITLPEKSFENSSFGARYNVELPGIGFSVSWFRGFDPFHGYDIRKIDWSSGTPEITGSPRPYLKNTIGADFALPLSSWIFRGELACDFNKNSGEKIYIPQSNISYVMGAEHNFGGLNTIIQYAGKYVPGYVPTAIPVLSDPSNPAAQFRYAEEMICYESALFNRKIFNLQKKTNHALMINLTRSILHDAWNLKMTAYYNLTSDDYFIRPEVSWKIADAVSFSAGGTYMNGPARSVFNYSNPLLSGMFLELKVDF